MQYYEKWEKASECSIEKVGECVMLNTSNWEFYLTLSVKFYPGENTAYSISDNSMMVGHGCYDSEKQNEHANMYYDYTDYGEEWKQGCGSGCTNDKIWDDSKVKLPGVQCLNLPVEVGDGEDQIRHKDDLLGYSTDTCYYMLYGDEQDAENNAYSDNLIKDQSSFAQVSWDPWYQNSQYETKIGSIWVTWGIFQSGVSFILGYILTHFVLKHLLFCKKHDVRFKHVFDHQNTVNLGYSKSGLDSDHKKVIKFKESMTKSFSQKCKVVHFSEQYKHPDVHIIHNTNATSFGENFQKFVLMDTQIDDKKLKQRSFRFKIQSPFQKAAIGICDRETVINNDYQYIPTNPGALLLSQKGWVYNSVQKKAENSGLEIIQGDIIEITYKPEQDKLVFTKIPTHMFKSVTGKKSYEVSIADFSHYTMHICVVFYFSNEKVEYLGDPDADIDTSTELQNINVKL